MTLPSQSKTDTMQLIELAEGVEVEARPAGPVSRARAWMIDGLIMALIFVALLVARGFRDSCLAKRLPRECFCWRCFS